MLTTRVGLCVHAAIIEAVIYTSTCLHGAAVPASESSPGGRARDSY